MWQVKCLQEPCTFSRAAHLWQSIACFRAVWKDLWMNSDHQQSLKCNGCNPSIKKKKNLIWDYKPCHLLFQTRLTSDMWHLWCAHFLLYGSQTRLGITLFSFTEKGGLVQIVSFMSSCISNVCPLSPLNRKQFFFSASPPPLFSHGLSVMLALAAWKEQTKNRP